MHSCPDTYIDLMYVSVMIQNFQLFKKLSAIIDQFTAQHNSVQSVQPVCATGTKVILPFFFTSSVSTIQQQSQV